MGADSDAMFALADQLEQLSDAQWNAQSLCEEWRVRDVVAHMTAGANGAFGPLAVIGGLLRYRFDHNRWIAADGRERGQHDPANLLADFRAAAHGRARRLGEGSTAALAHIVIHGQDICRPLGLRRELPEPDLIRVAEFAATSFVLRSKKRIKGVRLQATDLDWSHGSGPELSGPAEALIMMMAGRPAALPDLCGDGLIR